MLLSIQYTFADSRTFLGAGVKLVGRPVWPGAGVDTDFVRSFGGIKERPLGGLTNWVNENALCEANRALRFASVPALETEGDGGAKIRVPLRLAYRRFYFDGQVVAKFEVGVVTEKGRPVALGAEQTRSLLRHFTEIPVTVPAISAKALADATGQPVTTTLGSAGKHLARFYAAASMKRPPPAKLEDWWVRPGSPLLFLVHTAHESLRFPFRGKTVPPGSASAKKWDLALYEVPAQGRTLRMWVLGLKKQIDYREARALKICLLRLHAEHECMRLVLQNVASDKLAVEPRSEASDDLQTYFNEATRRISGYDEQANKLTDLDLAHTARETGEFINPGERQALFQTLRNVDVRKNIFRKVEDYVYNVIYANHINEVNMSKNEGDNINISGGQVGAVGRHAVAHDNAFNQWFAAGDQNNLPNLAKELAQLRAALKKEEGSEDEKDAAVGAVAAAEAAARKNDGPKVFEHLANAGKWALEVATKIGVPIAIEAIKKAVGMPV